jgi:hypothetical protein
MKPKSTKLISCVAVLIGAVVLLISGLLISRGSRNHRTPRSSSETLSIIRSATAIETYRVKSSGPFGSERIGNYSVVGNGLTPNPEAAKQLKAILLSHLRAKANPMGQKGCPPPVPGVAIRFIQGDKSVDILLCFQCYDLMVVNDATSEWRDFNFPETERDVLVKVAKSLFPNDADIQKISATY